MAVEEETEYGTVHYRCIDPIENFKIKIILEPVKTLHIPLPQFNMELSSDLLASPEENQLDIEEYTFKWQEKVFSINEIKRYSNDHNWKQKLMEKYHYDITDRLNNLKNYPNKVFSYVEADNFSLSGNNLEMFTEKSSFDSSLSKKMRDLNISVQYIKHFKNISKRKIINYYPSEEFKKETHLINRNLQKMFIMLDFGTKDNQTNKDEENQMEGVLVSLCYDHSNCVLQMTPPFSKSKLRPYVIGRQDENSRNFYHYWIYHESDVKSENLTKEIQLMSKVFDYQEEIKKLQLDTEFFIGKPDHFYMTLYGEIISAQDFEYDNLHIHYFVKLPSAWGFSDIDSLTGRTQSCQQNSQGICNFSHLFEMNFFLDLTSQTDSWSVPLELFFEVLSVDKYKRFRNEGYTYVILPNNPGMHKFTLKCWRISDQNRKSQLERFFIGGGPELEDVSYVGLSSNEKTEITSRFGIKTIPSGSIKIKLNILHQSVNSSVKRNKQNESDRSIINRLDASSLLGSVNTVLEAFRRARERMLEAKRGLQTNLSLLEVGGKQKV